MCCISALQDLCSAFVFQELVKVHKGLLLEIQDSVQHKSAKNLYQIFITFKERYTLNVVICLSSLKISVTSKHKQHCKLL